LVAIVIAEYGMDGARKTLSDLHHGEWGAKVSAKDQGIGMNPCQECFQLPDVVMDVRQNGDLH
jgi:hypothetical protein